MGRYKTERTKKKHSQKLLLESFSPNKRTSS